MRQPLTAVKIGGSLAREPALLRTAIANTALLGAVQPVVVIPGGGVLADAVRALQAALGLGDTAAHWMALSAMDQMAEALADLAPGFRVVSDQAGVGAALEDGAIPVVAPAAWMQAADILPHSWDVTSDSVAAFIAGALDACELVLVKRTAGTVDELCDAAFRQVAPVTLPVRIVTADGLTG